MNNVYIKEEIIEKIKDLVKSKGYIYALCMLLLDDFHIDPVTMHEINYQERLSVNEVSLLLGFLIQDKLDFTPPDTLENLIELKQKTYDLMKQLHVSIGTPILSKMEKAFNGEIKEEDKTFFNVGEFYIEPIFYSGTGAYDFQYIDYLDKKYKYDTQWLETNKNFNIKKTRNIIQKIKNILSSKSKVLHLKGLKEIKPDLIEKAKKIDKENWEEHLKQTLLILDLHQYCELFFDENIQNSSNLTKQEIREKGWKLFYQRLIDLLVVKKEDFDKEDNIEHFLENFSIVPDIGLNSSFQNIGNYNIINSHPIIKLDDERYFIPNNFLLCESVYESPFYWMWQEDKNYRNQLSKNRGNVGEEITYNFLNKIFRKNRTFKSVKIIKTKNDVTDIDVLCILGSKALCVQVKSKKLTELSRTGNLEQLQNDFSKAVNEAYQQGLVCRKEILSREAIFLDEKNNQINLSEEINEVYIMCITTENYPALTHQAHVMLQAEENQPYPIVMTVFDLELVSHYLKDPFDFLYYVRQRISLIDYFTAAEEISFLGYHLLRKLWKEPNIDFCTIDSYFAQTIDRNYFPYKSGIDVPDDGDMIVTRWKNENFNNLCNQLKTLNQPKITDIIFHLLDLSGKCIDNFITYMMKQKQQTLNDGKTHDFSIPPDLNYKPKVGLTYISFNTDNPVVLEEKLLSFCMLKKYKSKADVWIGFGSLKNSTNIIDAVVLNNSKWAPNVILEDASQNIQFKGKPMMLGKKVGRNDPCPCNSGLKFKKCCYKLLH